jgi:hypothetical protein
MTNPLSEAEIYQVARKRVEEKKGFYTHLASYVVVNAMLVIIWAITSPGYPWFIWPLAGWGIGIIFHFLGVFAFNKGTAWESKEIEKEAERLRKEGTGK